jgi:hypothetical protein
MKLKDSDARELYRQASRQVGACPPAADVEAAARGELPQTEKLAIAQHLAVCSACSEVYLEVVRSAVPKAAAASVRGAWRRRPLRLLQVAAAVTLAVGVGWLWQHQPRPLRSAPPRVETGEPLVDRLEPPDRAVLEAPPAVLRWRPAEGARYRVVLFDGELERLWESSASAEAEVRLPASVRRQMGPGSVFHWRVIEQREVEQRPSALHTFRIAGP